MLRSCVFTLLTVGALGIGGCTTFRSKDKVPNPTVEVVAVEGSKERGPVAALKRTWGNVTNGASTLTGFVWGKGKGSGAKGERLEVKLKLTSPTFSVSKDRQVNGVIMVWNHEKQAQLLRFSRSRRVEAVIRDSGDQVVSRMVWEKDLQDDTVVAVNPGERVEYGFDVPLKGLVSGRSYVLDVAVTGGDNLRVKQELKILP